MKGEEPNAFDGLEGVEQGVDVGVVAGERGPARERHAGRRVDVRPVVALLERVVQRAERVRDSSAGECVHHRRVVGRDVDRVQPAWCKLVRLRDVRVDASEETALRTKPAPGERREQRQTGGRDGHRLVLVVRLVAAPDVQGCDARAWGRVRGHAERLRALRYERPNEALRAQKEARELRTPPEQAAVPEGRRDPLAHRLVRVGVEGVADGLLPRPVDVGVVHRAGAERVDAVEVPPVVPTEVGTQRQRVWLPHVLCRARARLRPRRTYRVRGARERAGRGPAPSTRTRAGSNMPSRAGTPHRHSSSGLGCESETRARSPAPC